MSYCKECGKKISEKAEICVSCGVRQKGSQNKSRGTAIVLAVFLSFWTWCYTYKKDAEKFWIGLVLGVLLFWTVVAPIAVWIWAMATACGRNEKWYSDY